MPGAFHHFDTPNDSSASLAGVHPGIFRQPVSPSPSASVYLGRSTGSLYSDAATPAQNVKRKRHAVREPTPLNDWTITGDSMVEGRKPDLGSRKISGGKRRYVLAGQINTPNGGATAREFGDSSMEDSVYSDIDYRRALGSKRPHAEFDSARLPNHTTDSTSGGQNPRQFGWSAFALQTIGGVVGKVWEFCKTGAFRGFYAGGGKGYDMQPPTPSEQRQLQQAYSSTGGQVWCNEHDIPTLPSYDRPSSSGYPQSDYSPYYYERETPEESMTTPPPPAPKRRQIHDEVSSSSSLSKDESIRRNWVVVDEPAENDKGRQRQQRNSSTSSFVSRVPTGSYNPHHYQKQYQRPSSAAPRRSNLGSRSINRLDPPRFSNQRASSRAGVPTIIPTTAATIYTASPLSSPSKSHEPASYASPRSTASAAPVGMGMGPAAIAAPASPTAYPDPQRSPSRIPVPVSHDSRPQTPSNNIGGRAAAFSPASRIASPSPSPYATKIRSGGGGSSHQRRQSTASTASTAMPRPSSSSSNYRRTPVKGAGAGAHRAKRADSMVMVGGVPGAAAATATSPTRTAATSAALDLKENSSSNNHSPRLDREAQRLAAQRRQAEREADLRINDFNARLREMIRQGKEALGTSVEVDLLDDDGYAGRGDPWEDD
ncbi:hypothetical protein SLS62_009943 [Diatrype stigma]|uniref:Uncharacterized protein n=1 Tax=Diatrype stigma TaxID=117547 RepID=A0AAN9YJF9_9PEZI